VLAVKAPQLSDVARSPVAVRPETMSCAPEWIPGGFSKVSRPFEGIERESRPGNGASSDASRPVG